MSFHPEEYRTIRDEMQQRFHWTRALLLFSLAATATLLSWLLTRPEGEVFNPIFLIPVGLALIYFLFHSYRDVLEQIYHLGGYLLVFHELELKGQAYALSILGFHTLSRYGHDMINDADKEKNAHEKIPTRSRLRHLILGRGLRWGSDAKRGGVLLGLLTVANILGPLYLLSQSGWCISLNWLTIVAATFGGIFFCLILATEIGLWTMDVFVKEDVRHWLELRHNIDSDPSIVDKTLRKILGLG